MGAVQQLLLSGKSLPVPLIAAYIAGPGGDINYNTGTVYFHGYVQGGVPPYRYRLKIGSAMLSESNTSATNASLSYSTSYTYASPQNFYVEVLDAASQVLNSSPLSVAIHYNISVTIYASPSSNVSVGGYNTINAYINAEPGGVYSWIYRVLSNTGSPISGWSSFGGSGAAAQAGPYYANQWYEYSCTYTVYGMSTTSSSIICKTI